VFAVTNELRTRGTDNLLAAATRAGTRRVIAQGYAGAAPDKPSGGALKTEADPLDWLPVRGAARMPAAITYVDKTVPLEAPEGIVLRYGTFYGPGGKPPLRVPAWIGRLLAGEFVVAQMTSSRGSSNQKARKELGWVPQYLSWREGFRAWGR
jgi:nucleoside-diphosphate-sugar epimerase